MMAKTAMIQQLTKMRILFFILVILLFSVNTCHASQIINILDEKHGGRIDAIIIVHRTLKKDDIRPIILKGVAMLNKKYPYYGRLNLYLVPEKKELYYSAILAAEAEYDPDKCLLKILYDIPSVKQMEEYNKNIGKPILPGEKIIDDSIPLFPPDKKTFDLASRIIFLSREIDDKTGPFHEHERNVTFMTDEKASAIGKILHLSPNSVRRYYDYLYTYFFALGEYGKESVNLRRR